MVRQRPGLCQGQYAPSSILSAIFSLGLALYSSPVLHTFIEAYCVLGTVLGPLRVGHSLKHVPCYPRLMVSGVEGELIHLQVILILIRLL